MFLPLRLRKKYVNIDDVLLATVVFVNGCHSASLRLDLLDIIFSINHHQLPNLSIKLVYLLVCLIYFEHYQLSVESVQIIGIVLK